MFSLLGGVGRAVSRTSARIKRAARILNEDERGAEGLEKILILAAVALPLLGLLIWFKDDLATWIKTIWGDEKARGDTKLYGDGGTYTGN